MSAAAIERELAQYQDLLGYRVRLNDVGSGGGHVYVFYNDQLARILDEVNQRADAEMLAKKALKIIRDHQKAMQMLGPLVEVGRERA